jgi:hypothetical protein
MRILVLTQDLRISGTSAGIGRRSFLAKLKKVYPQSVVDVLYISNFDKSRDNLENLSVDTIICKRVNHKIPFHIKWMNRLMTRVFNFLYAENYIHKQYAKHISQIDYKVYNHIFVFSSGIKHETILATHGLPILKKAIIIFHDPYPHAWYEVKSSKIHKNEFLRLRKMIEVVQQSKSCCATAYYMAKDLQHLYASDKNFYNLPHFFEASAFNLINKDQIRKKGTKLQISYHGALMLGRNIFNLLEAYVQLLEQNPKIQLYTEFVLRVKGEKINELKEKFGSISNINILGTLDFSNSYNEQLYESDINIILENGPHYSNILPGKVPLLVSMGNPVFVIAPERSELRRIAVNEKKYIADMHNVEEIKAKLEDLINEKIKDEIYDSFEDYFSDERFKNKVDEIIDGQNFKY